MSKFGVNFIVDSKYLGDVIESLHPYKVEDLGFKLVAGTATKPNVKAGDKKSWEMVVEIANATPQPMKVFREKLIAAGFKTGSVYNAIDVAVGKKLVAKKSVKGSPHIVRVAH
jgi:hydroxylamine reductase (hybrid-cluster protein)